MLKRKQGKTILFFVAFVVGGGGSQAAEIQFHDQAQVGGALIRLGDIATVLGEPAEVAKLRSLELAVAPSNGRSRRFGWQQIRELLILRGVNPIKHRLSGAASIDVRSSDSRGITSTGFSQSTPGAISAPAENLVAVTTRSLRRGQLIGRNDVRMQPLKTRLTPNMVRDMEGLIGMQVSRSIATGRVIQDRDVQAPILVKRSELATLYVRVGQVRIRMNVKSLSDGALHDTVTVESLQTKQRYSARIIGYQEVEVLAQGVSQPLIRQPEPDRRARYGPVRPRDNRVAAERSPFRTASLPRGIRQ